MTHPSDKHYCPLLGKEIFWGGVAGCYEIQEVRDDNMDIELLGIELDLQKANEICEKCGWLKID